MLVILGFLLAALLLLLLLPAYRRRVERFAVEQLKRTLPLTESEIRADKDRLRAEYALDVHKLEMKLEESALSAARQSVEINRREAKIHDLDQAIMTHQMSVEEHENARRVLEQAILDRLPKVEQRLAEARKLLLQRDREIMLLTDTSAKQSEALEEATQINTQQSEELDRVKTALGTRAARNRETLGDPRFDGEVALRSEIESLRAKTRDQAAMLDRLQRQISDGETVQDDTVVAKGENERLRAQLAKAEAQVLDMQATDADQLQAALQAKIDQLEAAARYSESDMAKLKAALKAYEDGASDPATGRASAGLSAKVEINQLQAEVGEQRRIMESLRAEIAGNTERLARQAQHFRDELRRLGGTALLAADGSRINESEPPRRSLAERIAAPRVPASDDANSAAPREARTLTGTGTMLTALNGGAGEAQSADVAIDREGQPSDTAAVRRPRLLERISGADKQG